MEHGLLLHQGLSDAIGSCSDEAKSAVFKALSYLGVWSSHNARTPFEIELFTSVATGTTDVTTKARFNLEDRVWDLDKVDAYDQNRAQQSDPMVDGLSSHTQAPVSEFSASDPGLSRSSVPLSTQDWTQVLPRTDHVEFLKSRDWAATALGPMQDWPKPLRLMTLKMLSDPRPANLYWGSSWTAIYNEPFSVIAASRHPAMMGATAQEAMPATWDFLSPVFEEIKTSGTAFSMPEFEMSVEKVEGFVEEAWYDGVFSPIRDVNGQVLGLYNSGYEKTEATISSRYSQIIHRLSAGPSVAEISPWQHIVESCREFERDVPLLLVYSADREGSTKSTAHLLQLEGTLGISKGHPAAPVQIDLHNDKGAYGPAFQLVRAKGSYIRFDIMSDDVPKSLRSGVNWRGHGEPATHIVVVPLFTFGMSAGFIVLGLNPRRPFDEAHERLIVDIGRISNGLLASSLSIAETKLRAENLAQDLTSRQRFLQRIAEVATVGLYTSSFDGVLTWANREFYSITGIPECLEDSYSFATLEYVLEEDRERAKEEFLECALHNLQHNQEVRLTRKWTPPGSSQQEQCWIMISAMPNVEDGVVTEFIGCVTDISHLKWAEKLQANTAEAAKEAKRQQELFIDNTSHEMRNPLSAILQCADDIVTISHEAKTRLAADENFAESFETIFENARTIFFCASHQKRIIDDILTVSKLDSSILAVIPVPVDPVAVTKQALRAFRAEMTANDIQHSFTVHQSLKDLNVRVVLCDPSRLVQILINLITNAIKFTKMSNERRIDVRVGAFHDATHLQMFFPKVKWFPSSDRKQQELTNMKQGGQSDKLYLIFEVEDSGIGISADEMQLLFQKFAQGNPKTHITYGGSGLGLFISRKLAELQGGLIGSASVPEKGSIFAFYIEVQRSALATSLDMPPQCLGFRRPQNSPPKPSIGLPKSITPRNKIRSKDSEASPTRQRSLLLVEDNMVNQKVLSRQLQRAGHHVHVANNGLEALELIERTRFWRDNQSAGVDVDIILMDWEMPVMDGLTCTRRIRDLERRGSITKHLPVIAITANARPEQVDAAMAAGMDDIITKPFTVSALLERIESLILP